MGTRRQSDRITIPRLVRRVVEFQAAESFPLEVAGILVGDHSKIETVGLITKYLVRTRETLEYETENSEHIADEVFDGTVGSFHSHPGWPETISRPGLYKNGTKKDSDLESMEEDDLEWIVSIWPGKRRFCFRHRVYMRVGMAPRIVPVNWV